MKIQFYCYLFPDGDPSDSCDIFRAAKLVGAEPLLKKKWKSLNEKNRENCLARPYTNYLFPSLETEYGTDKEYCEEVLAKIDRLERKEIDQYAVGGNQYLCTLNQHEVVIENYIFGECYEWPLSTFPLVNYKIALQGWRKFLDIPKTIDSELIIDLPEVTFHDIDND
jgi:hypothetical protein